MIQLGSVQRISKALNGAKRATKREVNEICISNEQTEAKQDEENTRNRYVAGC